MGSQFKKIDDDRLRDFWADPIMRQADMAAAFGVSRPAITVRARVLDLPPRDRMTDDKRRQNGRPRFDVAEARRLHGKGMSISAIAERFDVTPDWVRRRMDNAPEEAEAAPQTRPLPVAPAHPFWTTARDALVWDTQGRYARLAAVAAALGQSTAFVTQRWHRLRRAA
jgi:transposase-like protein